MQRQTTSFRHRLWQRSVGIVTRIVTERASASRIGWAVALGVLVGTTPFFGLHLPICILLATLVGLNRAVTYLAANISIPPVAPLLAFASIQLGTLAHTGEWMPLTFATFVELEPAGFFRAWLLGSLILGSGLALPAGILAFGATHLYRRRHPLRPDPLATAVADLESRYRAAGRWASLRTRVRLRHDPIFATFATLNERAPLQAPVVDLGCDDGALLLLLCALTADLAVIGIDPSAAAIARARQVGNDPHVFRVGALGAAPVPAAGTVLIIDRLRTVSPGEQDGFLAAAAAAVRPGGHLYIREVDVEAGARNFYALVWDRLAAGLRWRPGGRPSFRPASEIAAVLEKQGLGVTIDDSPDALSDVLIVAQRPAP